MAAATNFLPVTSAERVNMSVGAEYQVRKVFKAPTVYGAKSKGVGSLSKILASDLGMSGIVFINMMQSASGTYFAVPLTRNQTNTMNYVEVIICKTADGAEVTDETDLSAERFMIIAQGNLGYQV